MSQQQKQPFWYRFLRLSKNKKSPLSTFQNLNNLTEVKIITENDLKVETILMEEFKFRGDCIKQILSDITNTFNLYFLFLGVSISGIGVLYQLANKTLSFIQILVIMSLIIFGIGNTLFFIRFISLGHIYMRHRAVMNVIRGYYVVHLQSQIRDIRKVFGAPQEYGSPPATYGVLLLSILAAIDFLCFSAAAFILTELWLNINNGTFLSFPIDPRPYVIGLLIGSPALVLHVVFYKFTLGKHQKIFRELTNNLLFN